MASSLRSAVRPDPVLLGFVACAAAALLASVPTTEAGVSEDARFYVHGLSLDGRISVNGTTIQKYRAAVPARVGVDAVLVTGETGPLMDPFIDVLVEDPGALWSALTERLGTRFALRRDGRVTRDDTRLYDLPTSDSPWLDLIVPFGSTLALRGDGAVAVNGVVTDTHVAGPYHFRRIVTDGQDVFCLRSDGLVFRNGQFAPYFAFRAGSDGTQLRSTWVAAAIDPLGEYLYALRADGVVARGLLLDGSLFGERVTRLPFDAATPDELGQLYFDFEFRPDGTWFALAGDGRVFTQHDTESPFADLPGAANSDAKIYTDIDVLPDAWFALRSDGRVYQDGDAEPLCELPAARHGGLAISRLAPVLGRRRGKRPRATTIRTRTVTGSTVRLPVVVRDLDTCAADLVITPLELPPGATWDATSMSLVWTTAGPAGDYDFRFAAADGRSSRTFTYQIAIRDPDTDATRNTRPLISEYGNALAVANEEFVLPVIVDDRDGDPLTVTVRRSAYPFSAGATFDVASRTFRWTPTSDDCGTVTVKFTVTDGERTRAARVRIRVRNGLFY